MTKKFHYSLIALIALLIGLGWYSPARALGIIPKPLPNEPPRSWFVYTLRPSETQVDTIVVSNSSDKPVTAVIEPLDATNTSEGGFSLVADSTDNQDLGKWITLEKTEIQLPAGRSAEVSFKLAVPSDASPGQHSAGIAVYEKATQSGGIGLRIRVGARVYVTVPGKVTRKIAIQKASYVIKDGKLTFAIQAKNESNVNLEPALDIDMQGLFRKLHQVENELGTYLPNSAMKLTATWKRSAPKLGYYRVKLTLHTWSVDEIAVDGSKKTLPDITFSYSFGFWVGGKYIIWLAGLLLLLWLGYRLTSWLRDRIKFRTKVEAHTVQKGETIMHLSERTGVFPQAIVKFNRLVWPYAVNAGDRLMVPTRPLTVDEFYAKLEREQMPAIWWYLISPRPSLYHPRIANLRPSPTKPVAAKRRHR